MISGIDLNVEFSRIQPLAVSLSENSDFDLKLADQMNLSRSYNSLDDKPKLDGRPIIGDIPELDPTVPDWAKSPTKPEYTAEDVGAVAEKDIEAFTPSDLEIMWDAIE